MKWTNARLDKMIDGRFTRLGEVALSKTPVLLRCDICSHAWEIKPNDIQQGHGCPGCSGQVPITNERLDERIKGRFTRLGDMVSNRTPILLRCNTCSHEWRPTPGSIQQGAGCPGCSGSVPITNERFDKIIEGRFTRLGEVARVDTKVLLRCNACAYEWEARPHGAKRGVGCPGCAGRIPITNERLDERIKGRFTRLGDVGGSNNTVLLRCNTCSHEWRPTPGSVKQGVGCPGCSGMLPITNARLDDQIEGRFTRLGDVVNALTPVALCCSTCSREWSPTPNTLQQGSGCPGCALKSDNDAVYIWRLVGQYFNGNPVYKIGITSDRLGDKRILHVARQHGVAPEVVLIQKVPGSARDVEKRLMALGDSPGYVDGDGHTEMRAMSGEQLATAVALVQAAA